MGELKLVITGDYEILSKFVKKSVYLENLGCPKNQVDSERILGRLKDYFDIVFDPGNANIIIINTCSFINSAIKESIETIMGLSFYKEYEKVDFIILTGCLVLSHRDELMEELYEIDAFITGEDAPDQILSFLLKCYSQRSVDSLKTTASRILLGYPGSAYLKISDGCNRKCSFCTIPGFKGPLISYPIPDLIKEANLLASFGVKEINLVAQETTSYGKDREDENNLVHLIEELSKIKKIKWIRLLYTFPTSIDYPLIEQIRDNPKVCPYIDIPFQHFNKKILQRMNRPGDRKTYYALIETLRKEIPDIAIRTTLIAGFPGETKSIFKELVADVQSLEFDHLGVFGYSDEINVESHHLDGKVRKREVDDRVDYIMKIQMNISRKKLRRFINKEIEVLIEENLGENRDRTKSENVYTGGQNRKKTFHNTEDSLYLGRGKNQAPEVDGNTVLNGVKLKQGHIYKAIITQTMDYDLFGEVF